MSLLSKLRTLAIAIDPAGRRIRVELRRVAQQVPPAECVLDLGSGSAPYADLFQHRRYVTADLIAGADVRCDAGQLPFTSGAFDLVLCTELLEHVPDPDAVLQEICRVLTVSGNCVLTTPLTWGVHQDLDFHRWTEMGLRQLLGRHHLRVLSLAPRGGILLTLGSMLQMIPWQLFGGAAERAAWKTMLYVVTYGLLLVPALLLASLDGLDRRHDFTHGYVVLCKPGQSAGS